MKLLSLPTLLILLLLLGGGCAKKDPPAPAPTTAAPATGKDAGITDFSDRPAPPGVKTGTPGG